MKSLLIPIFSLLTLLANAQGPRSPRFIEGIELEREMHVENSGEKKQTKKAKKTISEPLLLEPAIPAKEELFSPIEKCTALQFKYGLMLNKEVESIQDMKLYQFIDEWMNTPYHYGGKSKQGIDCSGFAGTLMDAVYHSSMPRTAREQYSATERLSREELKEGDLVFFNTRGGVSHVGVYLGNDFFVHSSTKYGVIISSLNDEYYHRRFLGGGRNPQQRIIDAEASR
jgi:lipoprotein Spr